MGEIRIVGPGKTRGYPYPVCKKRIVGPGKTRGYLYPVCKKTAFENIEWQNDLWVESYFNSIAIISG